MTIPGLVVFRYDAPLCFANANDFLTRALDAVKRQPEPVEWLLLNAEAIVEVDLTAADALGALHDELSRRGVVLAMARVKHPLRNQLERIGLVTHIGPERLFPTLPVALEAFERRGRPLRHGTVCWIRARVSPRAVGDGLQRRAARRDRQPLDPPAAEVAATAVSTSARTARTQRCHRFVDAALAGLLGLGAFDGQNVP